MEFYKSSTKIFLFLIVAKNKKRVYNLNEIERKLENKG